MSNINDDLDALLQEEDQTLPPVSQADVNNDGSNDDSQNDGASGLSPEEVEFNSLSGPAQDRFRRTVREKNELQRRIEELERGQNSYRGVPPPPPQYTPEVQDAVKKLSDVGISTDEKVDQKINTIVSQMRFYNELDRLEKEYSGTDGKPAFTREEYEDFTRKNPQYKDYMPEDVYNKMYSEEILDWNLQNKTQPGKKRSTSLRPTKTTVRDTELTPEDIESRLQQDDGPQWYEKNKEKINRVIARYQNS